ASLGSLRATAASSRSISVDAWITVLIRCVLLDQELHRKPYSPLEVLAEWANGIEAAARRVQGEVASPIEAESVRLERELKRVEADLARQTDLVSRGIILAEEYIPARDRLRANRETIQKQLADLTANTGAASFDLCDAVPVIEGLLQEWDVLSTDDRRRLLMELIDRVEVWRDRLAPARIVVVPRWEGGAPVIRELPGRHRMEELQAAIVKVLDEAPEELRYKELVEAVDQVAPSARRTVARAVRTLVEDGALTRRVVPGRATFYGLADPDDGQPREKVMPLAEAMRAERAVRGSMPLMS
ncbi:hypothetical protein ACTWPT_60045, partial [Nonomuraea sp. 3N208]|uniref:hypothetical protein n=1 Tax=Nonomuraea sp. 3N208 TaxID=3457421 RepID=UPI003FCFAD75